MPNQTYKISTNGMTLPEVMIGMMVMIIFASLISLSAKFLQLRLKTVFYKRDSNSTLLQKEHFIYSAMERWSKILSQPSYSKKDIEMLGCKYKPRDNESIWNTPGISDSNLPNDYKYCFLPTIFGESNMIDLVNGEDSARPGIYLLYAIPSKLSPNAKPIRKIICRPMNYC